MMRLRSIVLSGVIAPVLHLAFAPPLARPARIPS